MDTTGKTQGFLDKHFELVIKNRIKSKNITTTTKLALCFNLIQIPTTETVVLTISVIKRHKRQNVIPSNEFPQILNRVELTLREIAEMDTENPEPEYYYTSMKQKGLPDKWYQKLRCHRVFFIREPMVKDFIWEMFCRRNIEFFDSFGIVEVPVHLDIESHDSSSKYHYKDKEK